MKKIATILAVLTGCLPMTAQTGNESKIVDELSNKEEVIGWPESMSTSADQLLQSWQAKHYLYSEKEDKKNETALSYSQEDVQNRLHRLPTVIPMTYNNIVQECVDKYIKEQNAAVAVMLSNGNYYIPLFEEILDRTGLPLELKYLPVVESSLDPLSVSKTGAKGLWHLPLDIAQRYGLEINSMVDERYDPYRSTIAASQYLKDLYHIFGDWNLVIAAFNSDPNSITKAVHRTGGKKDYWAIYPQLAKEVRGYVPAFIAANYIMNFYCEHNIRPLQSRIPVKTDTVMVHRNLHMQQIAALCDIHIEDIKAMNPQYTTEVIPGASKPRALRMPTDKILTFIDRQDSIYNYKKEDLLTTKAVTPVDTKEVARAKEASSIKYVTIRRGDTLGAIARHNRTTVTAIKRLNDMRSDRITPGKRLRVR